MHIAMPDMTIICHHEGSLSEKIIDIENEGVEKFEPLITLLSHLINQSGPHHVFGFLLM